MVPKLIGILIGLIALILLFAVTRTDQPTVKEPSFTRIFAGDMIGEYRVPPGVLVVRGAPFLMSAQKRECNPKGSNEVPNNLPCYIDFQESNRVTRGLLFQCINPEQQKAELDCAFARRSTGVKR